ncbi:hypothetical protein DFR50_14032 [Roseiarcus fermentans]|uniref:Uncharacterized protein n=1 Tax=Roseiarcus fermentans TaxID=1473586 RepID=A0A366ERN6_9HYPH|nr:hypothetical protein DFR50_14032 [Roseiarcus fermentans]
MSDATERPGNCGACAFWRKLRESDGLCRRWAPQATSHPEAVAHWPLTHRGDGCGDGIAAAEFSLVVDCATCVSWRRPSLGLHPVNRGDMPMTWWAHAGTCTRHAPHPVREPGPRGFWPATLDVDGCGEGSPHRRDRE